MAVAVLMVAIARPPGLSVEEIRNMKRTHSADVVHLGLRVRMLERTSGPSIPAFGGPVWQGSVWVLRVKGSGLCSRARSRQQEGRVG